MALAFAAALGMDPCEESCAYFWHCTNGDCLQHDWGKPIPEHRYDWWYFCSGIPQVDLDASPGLTAECALMRQRHGAAHPRPRYVYVFF